MGLGELESRLRVENLVQLEFDFQHAGQMAHTHL